MTKEDVVQIMAAIGGACAKADKCMRVPSLEHTQVIVRLTEAAHWVKSGYDSEQELAEPKLEVKKRESKFYEKN